MTDELRPAGPLDGLAGRIAATRGLLAVTAAAQISLRGDAADTGFRAAVQRVTGGDLPLTANTATALANGGHVLWLGPDEWLLVREGSPAPLAVALADALAGRHAAVVDVSSSRAVIAIAGAHARAVLAKGCSLDLHPRRFAAGRCAQTLLARASVIIHQTSDAPAFRIHVRASLAVYLAEWLLEAAREFA